ncbi:unnamed protein product [Adineta steineri]|uniref:Uncharacterized protein n=1 Tax=Adineta steineri TaxID=433720 RepID=A0A814ZSV6_9BILA|nr:unnamed protein product [Adineta steineri]CAF1229659.1 unnamed protein product [Adineta steineri]CAF1247720.1 unnamed protein product [Adineta steineri]CAF1587741.1 unnamed protein product [Adineta steineri]
MLSKSHIIIICLWVIIGTIMCSNKNKETDVMDDICTTGGNVACRIYCFATTFSLTGYCDANNDCICNSTLTTNSNNNNIIEEVEVYIINK